MSVNNQQIAQAINIIEEQLSVLKQALGEGVPAPEGVVGVFDGEFMVEEGGKRHQVPPNYASKTMLVPGDSIRMIEDKDGGPAKYKQIGKVERSKSSGILVKKDGKFEVLTDDGSFKVLSASIKHYNGEVGDLVYIQYPKQHVKGSWAAVEKVVNQTAAPSSTPILEVQPVLADTTPTPLAPTPSPVAHVVQQEATTAKPQAAEVNPAAAPETRPASAPSASKFNSKSSVKSNRPNQRSGGSGGSSRPSQSRNSNSIASTPSLQPSAPVASSDPVNVESAFGEDDLV